MLHLEPALSKTKAKYGYVAFRSVPLNCAQSDNVKPCLAQLRCTAQHCPTRQLA